MIDGTEDQRARAVSIIEGLRGIQSAIEPQLDNIKVKVDPAKSPDLQKSVDAIFGDRTGDPSDGFITFKMYNECLKIVRAGGKQKASEIIKDVRT